MRVRAVASSHESIRLKHREGREHREEQRRLRSQAATVPILSSFSILCVLFLLCVSNLKGSTVQECDVLAILCTTAPGDCRDDLIGYDSRRDPPFPPLLPSPRVQPLLPRGPVAAAGHRAGLLVGAVAAGSRLAHIHSILGPHGEAHHRSTKVLIPCADTLGCSPKLLVRLVSRIVQMVSARATFVPGIHVGGFVVWLQANLR